MYIDMLGNKRYKLNLHTHTTRSDGRRSPEDAARLYLESGYDAIAITDHWKWPDADELCGLPILRGCEYNFIDDGPVDKVHHIVALFCDRDPNIKEDMTTAECIERITSAGGISVLAHPAWSLNDPASVEALPPVEFTEIYNTVSGKHSSNRPYSGAFVDLSACRGRHFKLIAADDTHYYDNDMTTAYIMIKSDSLEKDDLIKALRAGDFYASTGPEIHLSVKDGMVEVLCSPSSVVDIFTNTAFVKNHHNEGENLTRVTVPVAPTDTFVRAEATDENGRTAYSQIIKL